MTKWVLRGEGSAGGQRVCVRIKREPQISPLRCAPVEMTILFEGKDFGFPGEIGNLSCNRIVISTGAQRSGEICGSLLVLTQTLWPRFGFADRLSKSDRWPSPIVFGPLWRTWGTRPIPSSPAGDFPPLEGSDQSLRVTVFTSVYSCKAYSPSSRPMPDCLKPPKGALVSRTW
jgi:hypothetical protein